MRDLIVDGVPLRDPQGEWSIDYTRSKMLPEVSRAYISDPEYGFHGNTSGNGELSYFGTATESWVINVASTDKDDHRVNMRGLSGLFQRPELLVVAAPQRTPLAAAVRSGATFDISADAQLQGRFQMNGSVAEERINEATSRITVIMENLNAFWMSANYYTSAPAVLAGSPQTVVLDTVLADSDAPVTDGMIRIKGPVAAGGTVTVQDRSNAFRSVRYTAVSEIPAGQWVLIEMATLRAVARSIDTWSMAGGVDVSSRLTTSGDGAFFLSPGIGAGFPAASWSYIAAVAATGFTAGTTAVEFRVRRSYFA